MATDTYQTLAAESTGLYKEKESKFYAFAIPVATEEEALGEVDRLRAEHHKARHHCYAYRLGQGEDRYRANDDGEPNHSAGDPILGQIDSASLTNVVVVVVRYYGGTKLGVGGLINAYRTAAAEAIAAGNIVVRTIQSSLRVRTDYTRMSQLMQAVKSADWAQEQQVMDTRGVMLELSIRAADFAEAHASLWRALAEVYPGQERLAEDPEGYEIVVL